MGLLPQLEFLDHIVFKPLSVFYFRIFVLYFSHSGHIPVHDNYPIVSLFSLNQNNCEKHKPVSYVCLHV